MRGLRLQLDAHCLGDVAARRASGSLGVSPAIVVDGAPVDDRPPARGELLADVHGAVAFRQPPEDLSALLFAQARGCGLHKDSPSR